MQTNKLKLYSGVHIPNIELVRDIMSKQSRTLGIPMSVVRLMEEWDYYCKSTEEIKEKLIEIANTHPNYKEYKLDDIDFDGRIARRDSIGVILLNVYDLNRTKHLKDDKISFTKDHMLEYLRTNENVKRFPLFMNLVIQYKSDAFIKSKLSSQINFRNAFYQSEVGKSLPQKLRDEIYYIFPDYEIADTGRITTNTPNIQGEPPKVKSLIQAPEGYKILQMDITGQEVHILIEGIMNNQKVKNNYAELNDPYRAIMKEAGLELSDVIRSASKVPILALMNGMSLQSMVSDIMSKELVVDGDLMTEDEAREIALKLIKTVERDEGFISTIDTFVNSQTNSPNPVRRGLMGTELTAYKKGENPARVDKNKLRRRVRNGFFQTTAAEIMVMCIMEINYRFVQAGLSLNQARILAPIYDELVVLAKDENILQVKQIMEDVLLCKVDNWAPFKGEVTISQEYIHD